MLKKLVIVLVLAVSPALYAEEAAEEVQVMFHDFPWGTSLEVFVGKMGKPAHIDEVNGLQSLVYDNLKYSGYDVFMVVFFSKTGLEGGTYYFHTFSNEERLKCYKDMQDVLRHQYGAARLHREVTKDLSPFDTTWALNTGFVKLKIDTRRNDPVNLWISSPKLTNSLDPERNDKIEDRNKAKS
jgi:hypothetical protein